MEVRKGRLSFLYIAAAAILGLTNGHYLTLPSAFRTLIRVEWAELKNLNKILVYLFNLTSF